MLGNTIHVLAHYAYHWLEAVERRGDFLVPPGRGGMLFQQEVCFSTGFARKNVCKVSEVLGFNQGMIGLCREFCLLGMFNRRACINNYLKRE